MTTETTTTESPDILKLDVYKGKKVKVKYTNLSGKVVEALGTVEEANEMCLLFRAKGRTQADLILPENLTAIELDDSKAPDITQKTLKDVNLSTVRNHLADRHGWTLADVNELDEEQAYRTHGDLDHGPLGHTHDEIVAAEKEADGTEPTDDEIFENDEDEDDDTED